MNCYNIVPSVNDLESPFYLGHGRDLLEHRLSNLQSYCRYMGDQPGQLAVQELRKMWKLHTKLLTEPKDTKKVTEATYLKMCQPVFMKDHFKGTLDPAYIFNHRVAGIINGSTVLLTTLDGKEKRCNIHYVKLVSALKVSASVVQQFQAGIQKNHGSAQTSHSCNLHSKAVKQ